MRFSIAIAVVASLAAAQASLLAAASEPANQAAQVDHLFTQWDTPTSPGCAVAVMKDGRIVHERGYGMADLDHDVKITPTTVFHVGSISKQFTAFAILVLAQSGKISLDDPVRKYIPELPDFGVPITLRQLLHHTSGLRDWEELLTFDGWRIYGDVVTDSDVLAVMSRQKELNFPPGSEFMYSNTGYTLLAQVLARVSGQSFREFTTSRLFQPLGMQQTHFRDDHGEVVEHLASAYEQKNGAFELSVPNFDAVGNTNLLTTVEDLARWDENFYTGRVGGAQVIKQMQECGKLNDGTQLNYAAGLFVDLDCKLTSEEHSGGDAGYAADLIRFPQQHLSVATLCNLASIDVMDLTHRVANLYGGKLGAAPPAETGAATSVEPKQLAAMAGLYVNRDGDVILRIREQNGALWADSFFGGGTQLEALGEHRFRDLALGDLHFDAARPPGGFTVNQPGNKPSRYIRVPEYTPSEAQLREFVGTYRSRELDIPYYVVLEGNHLTMHALKLENVVPASTGAAQWGAPVTLNPVTADLFACLGWRVRFTRDAERHVSGFLINTTYFTRNLRFLRATP